MSNVSNALKKQSVQVVKKPEFTKEELAALSKLIKESKAKISDVKAHHGSYHR
ncbi:hypothetical protein [Burkholderia sp. Tr-20390]|uniref:hypothetical protein n=1 Tax=Burkholderia sp. Tr-20390 TaxID=2703904 RepID=UPI00198195F0|nr:hypothetical protein [Burkholderia sp. Tr-20390]MBN3731720.1 hypothetical protein [Burkholderia sp. Tr-20390]